MLNIEMIVTLTTVQSLIQNVGSHFSDVPQPLSVLSSDAGMAVLTKPRFLGPGGRTSRKMLKFPHAHQTKVLNALNYLSGIELTYGSGDMFEIEGLFLNFKNKTAAKESSTSILDASGWRP